MSNFYTLLTRVGAALHANAQVNQTTVSWTHMRLGDGNGAPVTPTENQTGLVRQVHTLQITDISEHPDNPNWVIVEAVVPSDVGGWTVRETAIYGGADGNTCIAVGNYPETYKPVLAEGAGREMVMRMVVQISSVATVKLLIDPAVAIASRAWVESLVATPDKAGLVKLASIDEHKEGAIDNKTATPAGVTEMLNKAFKGPVERIQTLENTHGHLQVSGNATLTGADNKLKLQGVVSALKLEKGDVIRIDGAGLVNAKLRTVESITGNNDLVLNYEHCGARGNGPLKLTDFTGQVTITRIAKWFNAAEGLGQDWVDMTVLRASGIPYEHTLPRTIQIAGWGTVGSTDNGDLRFFLNDFVFGSNEGVSVPGRKYSYFYATILAGNTYKRESRVVQFLERR